MKKTTTSILIVGYYGFGNTGDEVILSAMLQNFKKTKPNSEFAVISGNVKETEETHAVRAVKWGDLGGVINEIKKSDLVLIGGGGLFHDYWGFNSENFLSPNATGILYYCGLALLAGVLNKKIALYSVGVGPLFSDLGKKFTHAIAKQASFISVRDKESKEQLINLGIDSKKVSISVDPVFSLELLNQTKKDTDSREKFGRTLGIALRNWNFEVEPDAWETEVAQGLDNFLELNKDVSAMFIPFQAGNDVNTRDLDVANRIQGKLKNSDRTTILSDTFSFKEKIIQIRSCDWMLGMRLHSIIMAANLGVPVTGIVYDPKITNCMCQLGIATSSLNLQELSAEKLLDKLNLMVSQTPDKLLEVQEKVKHLTNTSKNNASVLFDSIDLMDEISPKISAPMQEILEQLSISQTEWIETLLIENENLQGALTSAEKSVGVLEEKYSSDLKYIQEKFFNYITEQDIENKKVLKTKDDEILSLDQKIAEESKISDKTINNLHHQITEERKGSLRVEKELGEIKKSRGWKLIWGLWRTRLFLIPKDSKREKLVKYFLTPFSILLKTPKKFFKHLFLKIRNLFSPRMSRHAFAFDLYKREREKNFPSSLGSLSFPSEKDLVSIVLPVYNGEDFLAEAIESILNQSYKNFELIIVNDGSTDGSKKIIENYSKIDSRIVVIHQENKKLPETLNRGFSIANGEFLTWTSHDNLFKPRYLERMVASLKENPDWDMCYANVNIIGQDGMPLLNSEWYAGYQKPHGSHHIHLPHYTDELNTLANNTISGAFLYRDRVKHLIGDYSPSQFTREDYDYWMQINALMIIRHVDFSEPVYEYRFHKDSLTSKDEELRITKDREALMVFDDFRRDFYLTPLYWIIEDEHVPQEFRGEVDTFKQILRENGHYLLDINSKKELKLPRLWRPCVYLCINSNQSQIRDNQEKIPENTLKTYITFDGKRNGSNLIGEWDLKFRKNDIGQMLNLDNKQNNWIGFSDFSSVIKAVDISVRSQALNLIDQEIYFPKANKLKISVIVCTYDRIEGLKKCLHSLLNQTLAKEDYEIVVVNNNPSLISSKNIIDNFTQENIKIVDCPLEGLSFARNAGISEAKGEIIVFIDDDASCKENLLETYWDTFSENPKTGVIGGQIILDRPEKLSIPWKDGWEKYWSHFEISQQNFTLVEHWWEFPWGANWAVRKDAILKIGGFRSQYGRRGNDFNGGEEIVAASLIHSLSYSIGIMPTAIVHHHVDPKRFTLKHMKKTIQAGYFVNYRAQKLLHLPESRTTKTNFRSIIKQTLELFYFILPSNKTEIKAEKIERRYLFGAKLKLLFAHHFIDYFKSFRKPITRKK